MPIKRLSYTKKRNIRKRTIKTRKRRMHKKMQGGSNTKIKLFNWGDQLSQTVLDKSITLFRKLLKNQTRHHLSLASVL